MKLMNRKIITGRLFIKLLLIVRDIRFKNLFSSTNDQWLAVNRMRAEIDLNSVSISFISLFYVPQNNKMEEKLYFETNPMKGHCQVGRLTEVVQGPKVSSLRTETTH